MRLKALKWIVAIASLLLGALLPTDWENSQWTVPINATVSQLLKLGSLPVQLTLGARYYAEKPEGGPDWGLRFVVTFLFPK